MIDSTLATVTVIHLLVLAWCVAECCVTLRHPGAQLGRLFLFAPMGLVHGLVPALALPRGWQANETLLAAQMALLGVISCSAGWRLYERIHGVPRGQVLAPALNETLASPRIQRALRRLFLLSIPLAVLGFLGGMIASAGSIQASWSATRFQYRGSGNIPLTILCAQITVNFGQLPGFLAFFLPKRYRICGVLFALLFSALTFVGTQGARSLTLGILAGALLGFVLATRVTKAKALAVATALAMIVLAGSGLYVVRRHLSLGSREVVAKQLVSLETYEGILEKDPLAYHRWLVAAVAVFPREHAYLSGATYRRILLLPIPRSIAGSWKPRDTHMVFCEAVIKRRNVSDATIPPTLMGDGYINFWGWPGVILVLFVNGLFYAFLTHRMRERPAWFLAVGGTYGLLAVMTVRGQPYENIASLLGGWALIVPAAVLCGVPIRVLSWRKRNAAPNGPKSQ